MNFTVTLWVSKLKRAYGRTKYYEASVVHEIGTPNWNGAHYKNGEKAMKFLNFLNSKAIKNDKNNL